MKPMHNVRAAIIGPLGVGRAHAISLVRAGVRDFVFYEIGTGYDEARRRFITSDEWSNEWGPIADRVIVGEDFNRQLRLVERDQPIEPDGKPVDYIVIATPTHSHMPLLSNIQHNWRVAMGGTVKIVCEKPITTPSFAPLPAERPPLNGFEWSFHPQLPLLHTMLVEDQSKGFYSSELIYVHAHDHRDNNPLTDLLPHLLSVLPRSMYAPVVEIRRQISDRTNISHVTFDNGLVLSMGYSPWGSGNIEYRSSHQPRQRLISSETWAGVLGIDLEWEGFERGIDLFTRMHLAYLQMSMDEVTAVARKQENVNEQLMYVLNEAKLRGLA